jgi:hypothetical protein
MAIAALGAAYLIFAGAPFSIGAPASMSVVVSAVPAFAGEDWKDDFDDICGKTQDAMSLSVEELKSLIERCDRLKAKVEAMDGSARKVALKRVQMCRDLYSFVLEQKEKK